MPSVGAHLKMHSRPTRTHAHTLWLCLGEHTHTHTQGGPALAEHRVASCLVVAATWDTEHRTTVAAHWLTACFPACLPAGVLPLLLLRLPPLWRPACQRSATHRLLCGRWMDVTEVCSVHIFNIMPGLLTHWCELKLSTILHSRTECQSFASSQFYD